MEYFPRTLGSLQSCKDTKGHSWRLKLQFHTAIYLFFWLNMTQSPPLAFLFSGNQPDWKKIMQPKSLDGWTVSEAWDLSQPPLSEEPGNHTLKKIITRHFCKSFPGTEEKVYFRKIFQLKIFFQGENCVAAYKWSFKSAGDRSSWGFECVRSEERKSTRRGGQIPA